MEEKIYNVQVKAVGKKPLQPFVEAIGTLCPNDEFTISTEVDGILSDLKAEEGTRVSKGMLLAQIEDIDYLLEVKRAEAPVDYLLMGLAKKNAILLVDYTNTLRQRGVARRQALLAAGPVRLRPILMTTFAMIFGMIPVAAGVGEGAGNRSPMGIAVIGGLLTSLLLNLIVVPVAYDMVDALMEKIFKKRKVMEEALQGK